MIARLGSVIYWFSLLATVAFFVAVYMTFVEEVEGSNCVLSEEDQRHYGGDLVGADLENMSSAGIECLLERKSNIPQTVYGDAPFYWLFCILISLVGYSIRYILTGIRNPLPWASKARS
jgi:hypothetical protein